jgi:hypothetical protein
MVESPADFFAMTGALPASLHDVRRYPRFFYRSVGEATIYPVSNKELPKHCFVVTRDLSRGGVGLLHNEQLFPGQRLDITLNGEVPRPAEVQWCKRHSWGLYAVGCRFVKARS